MNSILKSIGAFVIDIFETVIIALSLFVIIYLFAFQPHEVSGQSMDGIANFHTGQFILTDKVTYRMRTPERGEVIVFKYPLDTSADYIKRIIGLPGESILLQNNEITIFSDQNPNGIILDESDYLSNNVNTIGQAFLQEGEKVEIPEENYFVMGDNREESSDSRTWGFVPEENIIGRSFFRYWPPNEVGTIKNPLSEN